MSGFKQYAFSSKVRMHGGKLIGTYKEKNLTGKGILPNANCMLYVRTTPMGRTVICCCLGDAGRGIEHWTGSACADSFMLYGRGESEFVRHPSLAIDI